MRAPRPPRGVVILVGAVLAGAVLRVVGLGWGLPEGLHPDEWVIVWGALTMAENHTFDPSFYFRPDHVEIKLSFLAYEAYAHLILHSPLGPAYAADPGAFLLISRLITVAFGLAAIVLAWFIGRRVHPRVGSIAAVLFAAFPLFVEHAHYATPDVPITAMLLGVILACQHYLARPALGSLLIACACIALAIATKYPGAIATIMVAVVIVFAAVRDGRRWRILAHGAVAVVAVVVFLFAVSPVLFTNADAVVESIQNESRSVHPGADGLGFGGNLAFYAGLYLVTAGVVLTVAFVVGVVASIRLRITSTIPIGLGVVFWVVLSAVPLHWERWSLPILVSPLLVGAIGIHVGATWLLEMPASRRWRTPTVAILGSTVVVNLLAGAVAVDARFLAPDSRLSSAETLAAKGVTEATTIAEGYTALRPDYPRTIFDELRVGSSVEAVDPSKRYVATSSCMNDRYLAEAKYVTEQSFYSRLDDLDTVLSVQSVPQWQRSPLELVNIVGAVQSVSSFARGGLSGCDLEVYALDD